MNIEEQLIAYLNERSEETVTRDTLLVEERIIDSMGVMELIEFAVERFGVELDLDDLTIENFESVKEFSALILSKREETCG